MACFVSLVKIRKNQGLATQWDVTQVAAVSERCIHVEFKNGQSGFFDVAPYWDKGILKELQNPQYFKQVTVSDGYVTWSHGQDIAPENWWKTFRTGLSSSDAPRVAKEKTYG